MWLNETPLAYYDALIIPREEKISRWLKNETLSPDLLHLIVVHHHSRSLCLKVMLAGGILDLYIV